jgi:hypothetical protein
MWDLFIIQQVFIMMQERPIRPHQAIKPNIEVSAGGKAIITFLSIITSRDYLYSISDLRNVVSVPAEDHRTHRTFCARTHESVHIHYHSLWK